MIRLYAREKGDFQEARYLEMVVKVKAPFWVTIGMGSAERYQEDAESAGADLDSA